MLHSPEPNWDEGWTLTLARTWVERGVYGQLSLGQPRDPGLAASFPTVAPVALAFKLLGVGFWQGRTAIALICLASLGALAALARRLYGQVVGAAVVPVLLLTTIHATGNPLYVGRQAMGEPVLMLALCLAYLSLAPALAGSWPWALAAMLMGGLALMAKAQTMPFLIVSLLAPMPLLLWRRRWRMLATLAAVLAGSFVAARLIGYGWGVAMAGRTLPGESMVGLTRTVALVTAPSSRQLAIEFSVLIGVPALLGMAWAGWQVVRGLSREGWEDPNQVTRLVVLAFAGSWYGWFLLLAVGWARYLYPVVFLGAIFATAMLAEWTGGFRPRGVLARLRAGGAPGRAALVATALLVVSVPASLFHLAYTYPLTSDQPLLDTAAWLNGRTSPGAVIETNESELFVYLDRPYHSPPDQLHVVANQQMFLREAVPFDYNPLGADPDYLVVGRMGDLWRIYEPTLAADNFRQVQRYGVYTIYERVRP
nr:glycosyltransferase family 39 protein [Oscillochloris sp. ZM17-4]